MNKIRPNKKKVVLASLKIFCFSIITGVLNTRRLLNSIYKQRVPSKEKITSSRCFGQKILKFWGTIDQTKGTRGGGDPYVAKKTA